MISSLRYQKVASVPFSIFRVLFISMRHDDSKLVGRTFEAGAPYLVTAEGIANFCAAVGDRNPLYLDPEAAKLGPYGEIVAPPAFVASSCYTNNASIDSRASVAVGS